MHIEKPRTVRSFKNEISNTVVIMSFRKWVLVLQISGGGGECGLFKLMRKLVNW